MAYTFAQEGAPSTTAGLYRTVLRVMRACRHGHHDYVWRTPAGEDTVRPSALGMGRLAAQQLRRSASGETSMLTTGHEHVGVEVRYLIEKV
jgi:hypothetical protein